MTGLVKFSDILPVLLPQSARPTSKTAIRLWLAGRCRTILSRLSNACMRGPLMPSEFQNAMGLFRLSGDIQSNDATHFNKSGFFGRWARTVANS